MIAEPDPTARPPLSRERILRAAIDLADRAGIEALTMRRLAGELGVEAMTLYHYVANKDDLLNGIVDLIVAEIELPPAEIGWKAALRRTAVSAHELLVRHPWGASLMLHPGGVRPARLRYMDGILGTLRAGGFSAELTHYAYHALDSHILGFTLWLVGIGAETERLPDLARDFLATLPRDDYPWLAEHIDYHLRPDPAGESAFEFGLDLILDGLERRQAAAAG